MLVTLLRQDTARLRVGKRPLLYKIFPKRFVRVLPISAEKELAQWVQWKVFTALGALTQGSPTVAPLIGASLWPVGGQPAAL